MKKLIALILMLTMCVSLAACGEPAPAEEPAAEPVEEPAEEPEDNSAEELAAAVEYLTTMYRNAKSTHVADYQVVGKLVVGESEFSVDWTADSDTVKFVPDDSGMVTVDINELNPEEVVFNMTATVTDAKGNTETASFEQKVPAAVILTADMSYEDIVNAAYTLGNGLSIADPTEQTLVGKIVEIKDAYNEKYGNMTVIIQVGELADKPITCFRMGGEGIADLKVGDEITVTGSIKNYKGTIEFDAGCTMTAVA